MVSCWGPVGATVEKWFLPHLSFRCCLAFAGTQGAFWTAVRSHLGKVQTPGSEASPSGYVFLTASSPSASSLGRSQLCPALSVHLKSDLWE